MKAPTLLLLCGLSLAGAAAADPIAAPRHGPDRWIFGAPGEGYDLRKVPHPAQDAAPMPLPRPRPRVPQTTRAIEITPAPPTAPVPQPTPSAVPAPQDVSVPQPASAPLPAGVRDAAGEAHGQTSTGETPTPAAVEPAENNAGAAVSPVLISDAGGGRIRIEAHDASLEQVLAALQESHLIQLSPSAPPSRTVTGTYTGTLPQVISRILDGSNYFLHVTASGTELHAIGAAGDTNTALRSGISSNVDAAPAPAEGFSLSPANPASAAQARVTPSPAAKARRRHAH